VKVMLVPSSVSAAGAETHQFLTTFLINDTIAIDAGSLGLFGAPKEQARVRHVLISHSHIDHVGSLPLFVENVYEGQSDCVTIYGSAAVLESLRQDIFNGRVWPDFIGMSSPQTPFLKVETLESGKPVEIDGLRITPVAVNHVVPTHGFLIDDGSAAVVISSDTGPTDDIWKLANRTPHLKAVFLEATFPNALGQLATISGHHTPATFARDVQKLKPPVRLIALHIKPSVHAEVVRELEALGLPNLEIRQIGKTYQF
jgi:ribonuclease BN (tRNA processing enzyme)